MEPGYYDVFGYDDSEKSIKISDLQSNFSWDNNMQNEDLCSVDSGQFKSVEYHYSKAEFYKQSKLVYK